MVEQENISEEQLKQIENYNPVNLMLTETTGIVALAAIVFFLLFALLRAQKRIEELQEQLSPKIEA